MGGCRCSYRNCAVKSDGKTHMFHYPVFDKIRCHQWILNARRLDFLDLKVSQVKNRVICQHHFKDECFMNFTKGKLTFEAIPTEDGPYCDSSKLVDNSQDLSKLYPIVAEDIENDLYPLDDKKANFSLKYSDFLTNSESPEYSFIKNEDIKLKAQCADLDFNFMLDNNLNKMNTTNINQALDETYLVNDKLTEVKNKRQAHPILIVPPFSQITNSGPIKNIYQSETYISNNNKVKNNISPKVRPKVNIISETKITEPVSFMGEFKSISPSIVVNPVMKQNVQVSDITFQQLEPKNELSNEVTVINLPEINISIPETLPMIYEVPVQPTQTFIPNNTLNENNHTPNSGEKTKSLLKNKIPAKSLAVIKKKKFNKKLKNVLQSHAVKTEEPHVINEIEQIVEDCQEKVQTPKINAIQNDNYLTRLEARMTRMENLLLNKIDQNSKKVIDLTQSLGTSTKMNKAVSTQTNDNIDIYKKFLYTEISQYLSSETKNIIYEELFINEQFSQKPNLRSNYKRRKYR